jgi:hypothetical protein
MREVSRLDQVFTFGDKLSFLIPHEWVEGESGSDSYLYHYPDADSGWFRVSLITSHADDPAESIRQTFAAKRAHWVDAKTGNLVHSYEKDTEEAGHLIHIYYWLVGNFVPPDLAHMAVFSYTILREKVSDPENLSIVSVLSQVLPQADFYKVAR